MPLTRIETAALQSSITGSNITDGSILAADLITTSDFTFYGVKVGRGAGAVANNTVVGSGALGTVNTGAFNDAFGFNSLSLNTSGTLNTAIGSGTLFSNTTGANNVAVGRQALQANTTASSNTAVGYQAGYGNTTGGSNTALGSGAMLSNTTASNNVAVGTNSLYANTTGTYNTAVGTVALRINVLGSSNTAVGVNALRFNNSDNNTAVGYQAAYNTTITVATLGSITAGSSYTNGTYSGVNASTVSGATFATYPTFNVTVSGGVVTAVTLVTGGSGATTTASTVLTVTAAQIGGTGTGFSIPVATFATGQDNTAVGFAAMFSNTVGIDNTAVGLYAMYGNITASQNSAFGREALYLNTTGTNNVAIGRSALRTNTTASNNTAVGYQSLLANTTASDNTAVGYQAGNATTTGNSNVFLGTQSGTTNTTGLANTFVGHASGSLMTTGSKNTIVGRYNGNQNSLDIRTASNYVVLSDGDGNIVASTKTAQTFALQGGTLSSGTGIAFPATQSASSNANTLDDYEEGTWTPVWSPGTTNFSAITYAGDTGGRYTKIGRLVYVQFFIQVSSFSGGSGTLRLQGFPFTTDGVANQQSGVTVHLAGSWGTNTPYSLDLGGTSANAKYRSTANGSIDAFNSNVTDMATNCFVRASFCYQTS